MDNVTPIVFLENEEDSEYTEYYENSTSSDDYRPRSIRYIFFLGIPSLFCFLGIIGNGLVIWFGFVRIKKTVNVVWFLSLAIADFFFTLMILMYSVQNLMASSSTFFCKMLPLGLYLNSSVSVLQHPVISVDRCICVVFPVWCHNHRRPRLAFIIVLVIWIISFALAIPHMSSTETSSLFGGTNCFFDLESFTSIKKTVFGFVFYFLLPLIIIVSCYIIIILHMRRKRIFTSSKPFKVIAVIIIAFFICWFPSYLISFFSIFETIETNENSIYFAVLIVIVLIILNSCINPILYVFIGRDFKQKCCGSFQATFEKAFIENEEKEDCGNQEGSTALTRFHTEDK
ncbi:chemerin-like receptor 1 [Anomaloglossus baeobatrachus]|uniref:chemerin-like receptor 1 n=1 Tax=Anomaloglossus baeobatrachus TaxID=238106 RepID=UPI003F50AD0E